MSRIGWSLLALSMLAACAYSQQDRAGEPSDDERAIVSITRASGLGLFDIQYLPKRRWIVTSGTTDLEVWDAETLKRLFTLGGIESIPAVRFTPDESLLVAAAWGREKQLQVYSLDERKLVKQMAPYPRGRVEDVAVSPDGRYIAASASDGSAKPPPHDNALKVWEWKSGRLVMEQVPLEKERSSEHSPIAFNPRYPLLYESARGAVVAYDTRSWSRSRCLTTAEALRKLGIEGRRSLFTYLAVSPDGKLLAVEAHGGLVFLLDALTLEPRRWLGPRCAERAIAFSPDGKYLAAGSRVIRIWDTSTGAEQRLLNETRLVRGTIRALAFDATGEHLFSVGSAAIVKWRWRPAAVGRGKESGR